MQNELFSVLDEVDSTNNYAIAQIKNEKGVHGKTWFAKNQTNGKGQGNNLWIAAPKENIVMSVIIKPNDIIKSNIFLFNALVSKVCRQFLLDFVPSGISIKWPNDIYINDKKAVGVLIENIFRGSNWNWAVVGIGININQTIFSEDAKQATSIKTVTNKTYDVIELAKKLSDDLLKFIDNIDLSSFNQMLDYLNKHLYKKGEMVLLEANSTLFESKIIEVNTKGQLITKDENIRIFNVGEVKLIQK